MERAAGFEFTVTESGAEVLLLENLFIKRHKPRYNALLKDDTTYLPLHQGRPHGRLSAGLHHQALQA